jgi:nicotinamide phosphoribosyltransferase
MNISIAHKLAVPTNIESVVGNIDSYKASQFNQDPPGIRYKTAYIESRGGKYKGTHFFGPKSYLIKQLCQIVTLSDVDEWQPIIEAMGYKFNRKGWLHIIEKHGGRLPLRIQMVREGTFLPHHNVLVQITNTDPECAWLVTYIETALLRAVWYPTTVASKARHIKDILKRHHAMTSVSPIENLRFKLHNFGDRGAHAFEDAALGGAAHLINFAGTDSVAGVVHAMKFYGATDVIPGVSIPAGEHSVTTAWGKDGEGAYLDNLIDQYGKPGALFANPIDSYDTWNFLENVMGPRLPRLKEIGCTYVARFDSGHKIKTPVAGINNFETIIKVNTGDDCPVNSKGFKVLPPYLLGLQGDGIDACDVDEILDLCRTSGWSGVDVLGFGMGGRLIGEPQRDDMKFAMKGCAIMGDSSEWQPIFKDPVDDPAKRSRPGRLALVKDSTGKIETVPEEFCLKTKHPNMLEDFVVNGKLLIDQTFEEIRTLSEF